MRKLFIVSAMTLSAFLTSCGWSDNQKDGIKISMRDGFMKGLSNSGATIDEGVREEWLDCTVEKITKRWGSFDEFKKNQTHPDVNKFQEECAQEVGLEDAITVQE